MLTEVKVDASNFGYSLYRNDDMAAAAETLPCQLRPEPCTRSETTKHWRIAWAGIHSSVVGFKVLTR